MKLCSCTKSRKYHDPTLAKLCVLTASTYFPFHLEKEHISLQWISYALVQQRSRMSFHFQTPQRLKTLLLVTSLVMNIQMTITQKVFVAIFSRAPPRWRCLTDYCNANLFFHPSLLIISQRHKTVRGFESLSGPFVILAPKPYHESWNTGYSVAKAIYFADHSLPESGTIMSLSRSQATFASIHFTYWKNTVGESTWPFLLSLFRHYKPADTIRLHSWVKHYSYLSGSLSPTERERFYMSCRTTNFQALGDQHPTHDAFVSFKCKRRPYFLSNYAFIANILP